MGAIRRAAAGIAVAAAAVRIVRYLLYVWAVADRLFFVVAAGSSSPPG